MAGDQRDIPRNNKEMKDSMTDVRCALVQIIVLIRVALCASITTLLAQDAQQPEAPYCAQLKEINNNAMSRQRFMPLIGKPRMGSYSDTTMPLTGWSDCLMYGPSTYTCDSQVFETQGEAASAQRRIAHDILGCFAGTWEEAPDQTSADFLVLHPKLGPASITLNLDQTDTNEHIVRLIIFLRRL
jgi:hypothetical protein